jgi:hypothetical protein
MTELRESLPIKVWKLIKSVVNAAKFVWRKKKVWSALNERKEIKN